MADSGGNGHSGGGNGYGSSGSGDRGGGNGSGAATSTRGRGGSLYGVQIDRGQDVGVLRGARGPVPAADPARTHRFSLAQVFVCVHSAAAGALSCPDM